MKNQKSRRRKFLEFCIAAAVIYFVVKVPVMFVLTDLVHIHYIISGAIAGALPTIIQFIPSEFWVWKRND